MLEMIKKYANDIKEESMRLIDTPEEQAVVFTVEGLREFLREELEQEILEDYEFEERYEDWDEDYDTALEKLWNEIDWGDLQESVEKYTSLPVYFVRMDGRYYCIGNIDDLWDDTILDYAEWYNEEYYDGDYKM